MAKYELIQGGNNEANNLPGLTFDGNVGSGNLGTKFNNLQLVKSVGSPIDYLPSIRLDKPIGQQLAQQTKITAQSLAGRAKNTLIQTIKTGVSDTVNYTIGGKQRRVLISNGEIGVFDDSPYISEFGRIITDYLKIWLPDGETDASAEVEVSESDSLERLEFFDSHAIMSVNQTKNILLTTVQGRDKTRKELVSGGDYNISVSGLIVGDSPNLYPSQKVRDFIRLMDSKEVLECESPFLSMFGINGLIILNYNMPQERGFHNTQPYTFNAVYEPTTAVLVEEQRRRIEVMDAEIAKANGWVIVDSILDKLNVAKLIASKL